jgi:hypothetical protein
MKKRLIVLLILLLLSLAIQPSVEAQGLEPVYLPLVFDWSPPSYCQPPKTWHPPDSCMGSVVAPPPPIVID